MEAKAGEVAGVESDRDVVVTGYVAVARIEYGRPRRRQWHPKMSAVALELAVCVRGDTGLKYWMRPATWERVTVFRGAEQITVDTIPMAAIPWVSECATGANCWPSVGVRVGERIAVAGRADVRAGYILLHGAHIVRHLGEE